MRKDAQICLRLTKLQKEKIIAIASQVNMNITDYMVRAGVKRKITITNIPDLYDVKKVMNKWSIFKKLKVHFQINSFL